MRTDCRDRRAACLFLLLAGLALLPSCGGCGGGGTTGGSVNVNYPLAVQDQRGQVHEPPILRVLLRQSAAPATLQFSDPWELTLHPGDKVGAGTASRVKVAVAAGAFTLDGRTVAADVLTFQTQGSKPIIIDGQPYPGAVRIYRMADGTMSVVNLVNVEDYLLGVLPGEMRVDWPPAALAAQAVAARTYALWRKLSRNDNDFDVVANTGDQMYLGLDKSTASVRAAVESTRGVVLMRGNRMFPAYYHSTCGGYTEDASQVFTTPETDFLKGVRCDYCRTSPRFVWQLKFALADIQAAVRGQYPTVDTIRGIHLESTEHRVETVVLDVTGGTVRIPAVTFRTLIGAGKLYSTYFTAYISGNNLIADGKGWGHGVGLCQYGALGMAREGRTWADIVRLYYPGAALVRIY